MTIKGVLVSLSNFVADATNGHFTFDAAKTKGSFTNAPSRQLILSGFKSGLTDDQRIKAIQAELDHVSGSLDQQHSYYRC